LFYSEYSSFTANLTPACWTGLFSFFNKQKYRGEHVQAGTGRYFRQRKGVPQTHQDLGAVWGVDEDPQRPEEVSLQMPTISVTDYATIRVQCFDYQCPCLAMKTM